MTICNDLREAVLQAAIQGKLVEQRSEEGTGEGLYRQIQAEKQKLIKKGKIKKEKPSPPINEDDTPFDIPENWKWVRLHDVCLHIFSGKSPRYSTTLTENICIGQANNQEWGVDMSKVKYVTDEFYESLDDTAKLLYGDVLLNTLGGGTVGRSGLFVGSSDAGIITDGHLFVLRTAHITTAKFLLAYLRLCRSTIEKGASGTTNQCFLKLTDVKKYLIPFPPLAEQKRIVAKIDELMAKIDDLEKTENELEMLKKDFPEDMKASILQAAMQGKLTEQLASDSNVDDLIENIEIYTKRKISIIENDEVPENWRTVKISDVSSLFTGNSISQNVKATKYTGLTEGYNYIGTKDVGFNHQIAYDNGVKIPYDEPNFRYAEKGDTLLCIEGGSAGKKIAISDKKVCFGNKLCAFHTININNKFLYYYLQSPLFLNYFTNNLSGIIGGVSINKIKQLSIPVPPIEEQQRIVDKLDQLLPLCEILQERVE